MDTYSKVMSGKQDANIKFDELCRMLVSMGFNERIKGSHHVYTKSGVFDLVNIQPARNSKDAKAWQVRDIRNIFNKYGIKE